MAQIRVNYNRANLTLNRVYKGIALIIADPLHENKKGRTKRSFQGICQLFKEIFRRLFHPWKLEHGWLSIPCFVFTLLG